ncbi:head GIN domain-containing protein [Sphingomonas sp.]|jgi:hypothetical protein|uniref:head GIN domain-containing protein n=1 Tax=Sphingomonas sp. TaxID=28214 RepID=UPI002D7E2D94|nr:head GIN domain-containing protein [Sphingomonas sp.]HEU0045348.1 head GIN domain-containing protein [Sphingomonas sp.]
MRTVLFIAAILPLAACSVSAGTGDADDGTPGIAAQGSGNTRTFAVSDFTAVDLRGADDVDVRVGPGFSVRADGDAELLDHLKISKDGNTLRIARLRKDGWNWSGTEARISVTLPQLGVASVAGSGDMTVDRVTGASFKGAAAGSGSIEVAALQVERADISLAGSGDVKLAGTAKQLQVSIAGSGDVDAGGLRASQAEVSIAGSGSVRAEVEGPAKVNVMGSGDVDLGGKARCQTSKMGSGTIRCGG